ncbi:MAG: sigma-54 dependent transcriptional regulator [Bacteroidota bacterium]
MKNPGKILIIDDDNYIIVSIRILLEQHYDFVRAINSPAQIPTAFEENRYDVVVLDMNFSTGVTSGKDGLRWLQEIKQLSPGTEVILITAYGGIEIAVEAVKKGAFDFLTKPWENEKLVSTVAAAHKLNQAQQQLNQLSEENKVLQEMLRPPAIEIVGQSEEMQQVFGTIRKVADTDANVLILGENGTGKELAAKRIHELSGRKNKAFIGIDVGAIPESLFESELFGHRKGAFTDAIADRVGKFQAAAGGTIFLDEIGNIPLTLQARLLKVLQEREITRVGDNEVIKVDVRLLCATNMNLAEMVHKGLFRQDLLYRINTITLSLPALRDRVSDIPQLADHFLKIYKTKYRKKGLYVPEYVIKKLSKHAWPGNVRELQHAIERAVIMSDGKQLHVKDFSLTAEYQENTDGPDSYNLEKLEKWAVSRAIQKHQGNISLAAKELGLSRGAMYRRMEKYEL